MPLVTSKCANFPQLLLLGYVLLDGKSRCPAPNTTTALKLKGFDAVAFLCLSLGVTSKKKNRALERRKRGIKGI